MMTELPATAVLLANGPAVIDEVPIAPYPKFMLTVANRPLVEYQAALLAAAGVKNLIICLSRDCEENIGRLREHLRGYPLQVHCIAQPQPRGTGGTLKSVETLIRGDLFWLLGGDLLLDTDLGHMLAFHRKSASVATVAAVREDDPPWRNERIESDEQGLVKTIHRMHPAQSRRNPFRPLGLYLFDRRILASIPQEGYFDLKEQLFGDLHRKGHAAAVWQVTDYCRSISSLDNYMAANRDVLLRPSGFGFLLASRPPREGGTAPVENARRHRLEPLAIAQDASIDQDALLIGPTSIGAGCVIGERSVLNASLLLGGVRIGSGVRLTNCIVGDGAVIEDNQEIRDRVILGDLENGLGRTPALSPAHEHIPGEAEINKRGHINLRKGYLAWKRCFDSAFALAVLIGLSPLMLLIAIAIALDTPGRIIFRQRRCGYNGKDFTMYKFRTMVANAEEVKRQIQHLNEVDGPMFKIYSDPRVTRIGSLLRATNLDELPQFFNILTGKMALVGPRPLSWDEMRYNPRWRDLRITVLPGLIGLWQLRSHTKPSFCDWIHNDLKYVRECSAWLDFKILFLAVLQSIRGILNLLKRDEKSRKRVGTGVSAAD